MTNLNVFDFSGQSVKKLTFKEPGKKSLPNSAVLSQAILVKTSNLRKPLAHTKTRGEVRGGGAKPWKQKGTGRARAGSIRSPLWRGGGIVFGPTSDRNFKKRLPKKMEKKAFEMVFRNLIDNQKIILIKDWQIKEPKTKAAKNFLEKIAKTEKKITALIPAQDILARRAFRNLPLVEIADPGSLSLIKLFQTNLLLLDEKTFKLLTEKWL